MKATVLAAFDGNKKILIQTDSSQSGVLCCIMQDNKPISYASRSLTETEKQWAQIEKEMNAILYACTKFHNYIYGRRITVHTDHKPIVSIMNKEYNKIKNNRLKRIKTKLSIYDLEVKYLDYIKDDISINDVVHSINSEKIQFSDEKLLQFQKETTNDPCLNKVKLYYNNNWPSDKTKLPFKGELYNFWKFRNDITVNNNLIYLDARLIVPFKLRALILELLHETHIGMTKTIKRARSYYYWPNMANDIENFISVHCVPGIKVKNLKNPY